MRTWAAFLLGLAIGACAAIVAWPRDRPAPVRSSPQGGRAQAARGPDGARGREDRGSRGGSRSRDAKKRRAPKSRPRVSDGGYRIVGLPLDYQADYDLFFVQGSGELRYVFSTTGNLARTLWQEGRKGAAAYRESHDAVTSADIDGLLASVEGSDVLAGIGLAATQKPPLTDRLVAAVRDESLGSLRLAALLALSGAGTSDPAAADAIIAASRDSDFDVQQTAMGLLPRLGRKSVAAATEHLLSGNHAGAHLHNLARAVAASTERALSLMRSADPDVAVALIGALAARAPERDLARLRSAVRAVLPALLDTDAARTMPGGIFKMLTRTKDVEMLERIASTSSTPSGLRFQAVEAALRVKEHRDRALDLLAALAADARAPVRLRRQALAKIGRAEAASPRFHGLLRQLAYSDANAWVREDARGRLQLVGPGDRGDLTILSARYGKDGKTVDVRAALAKRVANGRLTVVASNKLAGDPSAGVVKELAVTFVYKGRRHVRTVQEGKTLTIP